MNGYNGPGEGWREVTGDGVQYVAVPNVTWTDASGMHRVWVREEPVPPLPTEPYTVIRVTWKPGHGHEDSTTTVLTNLGDWCAPDGSHWLARGLPALVTGFEVLAEPKSQTLRDHEDHIERDVTERVRRETAKAVIDRIMREAWLSDDRLRDILLEFGVES